ncbi:MAG: hypothetical protein IKJ43_00640 [Bacilli bacterium]|nr:hypothetical protein [Bacilli bacterium]
MDNIYNYKIVLISPTDDHFICMGLADEPQRHGDVLRKCGSMIFGEDSVFNILDERSTPNVIEHYLESYGYVVFYNLFESFGILCVMNEISESQRILIDKLLFKLEGYTIEFDYFNNYFDELLYDDPFEDSGDFSELKKSLDGLVVKDNAKEFVR